MVANRCRLLLPRLAAAAAEAEAAAAAMVAGESVAPNAVGVGCRWEGACRGADSCASRALDCCRRRRSRSSVVVGCASVPSVLLLWL